MLVDTAMKTSLLIIFVITTACTRVGGVAVVSIDMGTEYIKSAIVKPGVPMEIVLNEESKRKTPAVVVIKEDERLFGDAGLVASVKLPKNSYSHLLDLMGKRMDNPLVQRYKEMYPYHKLIADPIRNTVLFQHWGTDERYSVEELFAMMLNHTRQVAEVFAEEPISSAVITVPAYFNQAERRAVMEAAELVNLRVLQLISSSAAVALNYGVFRRSEFNESPQYMMFYDMGAAATTAYVVEYKRAPHVEGGVKDTVPHLFIRGTGFDRTLGGSEFDRRIQKLLVELFRKSKRQPSVDVAESPKAMAKLLKEAKRVKQILSANSETFAQIENLLEDIDLRVKVSRADLESASGDLFARVAGPVREALAASAVSLAEIEAVVLVGAGTRVPRVQEELLRAVGKEELGRGLNTDEAAALGAVYQAAHLSKLFRVKPFVVKEGAVYPLQVEFDRLKVTEEGVEEIKPVVRTLWGRSTTYPGKKIMTFARMANDFTFFVNYGDLESIVDDVAAFGSTKLESVGLSGVSDAVARHSDDKSDSKGVKAHFRLDESGLLRIDEVESVFEVEPVESPTAFERLGSTISRLFSGSTPEGGDLTSNITESSANRTIELPVPKENKTVEVNGTETDNSTAPKPEAKKPKPTTVKEPLTFVSETRDIQSTVADAVRQSKAKLKELKDKDEERLATAKAKNDLETFLVDTQDKLEQEDYMLVSSVEEREAILSAIGESRDWLYEDSDGATSNEFNTKKKNLTTSCKDIFFRVSERKSWPTMLEELDNLFNASQHFLSVSRSLSLDDPVLLPAELTKLEELLNETIVWKNDTVKEQESMSPKESPVLLSADISSKFTIIQRELGYLYNKVKNYKPKPKPEQSTPKDKPKGNATDVPETVGEADVDGDKVVDPDAVDDLPGKDVEPSIDEDDKVDGTAGGKVDTDGGVGVDIDEVKVDIDDVKVDSGDADTIDDTLDISPTISDKTTAKHSVDDL